MGNTTVSAELVVQQWNEKAFNESLSRNKFLPLISKKVNATIREVDDLTKNRGDNVEVTFIPQLHNDPVTGDDAMHGNEEELGNFGMNMKIERYSNATSIGKHERRKSIKDLYDEFAPALLDWDAKLLRKQIVQAFLSPNLDGYTAYESCTEAQKDAWVAAQYAHNRVLFGASVSNYSASNHTASLLTVDSTSDVLSPAIVSLLKRYVQGTEDSTSKYDLAPISDADNEEFVLLCQRYAWRDFRNQATFYGPLEYAGVRGDSNPLFSGSDLLWDGVRIVCVNEFPVISGVGAAGIDVAPCILVGASALGMAVAEKTNLTPDDFDYNRISGIQVARTSAVSKLIWDDCQMGIATLYVAGVADT
jgi:N4-gp56 family major capsid protein